MPGAATSGGPADRSTVRMAADALLSAIFLLSGDQFFEIPAALLLPPFFDPRADPAVNYGAAGSVIGAMIASGFGPSGAGYDAAGRLRDWLPPEDLARLRALAARLARDYSAETPVPGWHLKGDLLVDEAIADIGGIEIALDAYRASLRGGPPPVRDGFTRRSALLSRPRADVAGPLLPDFLRNQIATGSNAPPAIRVNGPLPHVDAWYPAFGIVSGQKLYRAPSDRLHFW